MKLVAAEAEIVTPSTYACPMHPEVTSSEPGTCPKCGMRLVPSDALPASASDQHEGHAHDQHDHGGDHGERARRTEQGARTAHTSTAITATASSGRT